MQHLIEFTFGDKYCGHGMHESFIIKSNYSAKELSDSCLNMSRKHDIWFGHCCEYNKKRICEDYEDNRLPVKLLNKFLELGISREIFFAENEDLHEDDQEDGYPMGPDTMFHLLMEWIKLDNSDFHYEIIKPENFNQYSGNMGYGLFSG